MQPHSQVLNTPPQYLSKMGKEQLIDLLHHKTKLLVTASRLFSPVHSNIKELSREVKEIQEAVKSRNGFPLPERNY